MKLIYELSTKHSKKINGRNICIMFDFLVCKLFLQCSNYRHSNILKFKYETSRFKYLYVLHCLSLGLLHFVYVQLLFISQLRIFNFHALVSHNQFSFEPRSENFIFAAGLEAVSKI